MGIWEGGGGEGWDVDFVVLEDVVGVVLVAG